MLNKMAKQFGIKVNDENAKRAPLHMEQVRNNFNNILTTMKIYEQKQMTLEESIGDLKVQNQEIQNSTQRLSMTLAVGKSL